MKRKLLSRLLNKGKSITCILTALLALVPGLAVPAPVLAAPAAPTALTAVIAVDPVTLLPTRGITLTWTSNSAGAELGFWVYRDTVNTFNSINLIKVATGPSTAPVAPATLWTGSSSISSEPTEVRDEVISF